MDPTNAERPTLWTFLVIVLAVLLAVVLGTSFIMHMIQRRQRKQLERRIANGEVDLETLGIKRLNVPQEIINKMPQYTFKSVVPADAGEQSVPVGDQTRSRDFFQPTCSICLDDFVYDETVVRELPCKHIFHPECIDPFLRENSSLCPLCKRSALPAGMCPITVTNVMVRRERLTRRLRESRQQEVTRYRPPGEPSAWTRRLDRIRGPSAVAAPQAALVRDATPENGTLAHVPEASPPTREDLELGPVELQNSLQSDTAQPPPEIARRGTAARRAWRRERVASMHAREYNEQAEQARREEQGRPLWRRVVGTV